jgi:hypothetical protein
MVDRVDVVRVVDDCRWEARSSAGPAGQVVAWRRPDRRVFVFFRDVVPEAYGPLVTAVDQDLGVELHTSVDLADERGFEHLCEVGFVPLRQESDYLIPGAEASEATGEARLADGYVFHNVLEIPEADLRRLDDRLRRTFPAPMDGSGTSRGSVRRPTPPRSSIRSCTGSSRRHRPVSWSGSCGYGTERPGPGWG